MKNFFHRYKWLRIIYAILLLAVGITATILTLLLKQYIDLALSITVDSTLFVIGIILFLSTLFNDRKEAFTAGLVYSSLIITLGILFLMNTTFIREFSLTLISVFMICFGATIAIKGIFAIVEKLKWYLIAAFFIVAAAFVFYGIITLIYQDIAFTLTFSAGGVAIAIYGLVMLIVGVRDIVARN
jgi:uncharacterized membrane protein HdeD (DUF308 family)